ncbi:Mce-associated membrane protein [Mycobacterium sp. MAA66]|uniref:hypothetical protein n=1 Tax=Mycobacterium sp. MAA66 TaxID=3156297 RepID=UPI0035130D55
MSTMAPPATDGSADTAGTDDVAAAEAHAALAEARARQARARADVLRRQTVESTPAAAPAVGRRSSRWHRIAAGVAALVFCAFLGLGAAMTWSHHVAQTHRQQQEQAAAVARQGVIDIMSLNFVNAEEDVQRILDNATGKFKQDFQGQQYLLVKQLIMSKVVAHVTVTGVAVQSATDDSAVVLVATTSQAANANDAQQAPKRFRVVVTLAKDQGRLKISDLAYL